MKYDWMDRLFAFLFLVSIAGNVANFHYNNVWIHGLNALPAVLFITIAFGRGNNHNVDNKISSRNRFGVYFVMLYIIQFGLEYLRQFIAGVSKSENYEHLAIFSMFIFLLIFILVRNRKRMQSKQNHLSSEVFNEVHKNGNS